MRIAKWILLTTLWPTVSACLDDRAVDDAALSSDGIAVSKAAISETAQGQPPPGPFRRNIGGKLMIIGSMTNISVGDVTDDAVFTDRLARDVGGAEALRILVVPGASGSPAWLYNYLQELVSSRGTPPENVELAHIASSDDDTTPDVDESTWVNGAYEQAEIDKISRANVVWFSGGDQLSLTALLLDEKGRDTPFQTALKKKLRADELILAGTSAGAAVMSDPMIANGNSWGALTMEPDTTATCEDGDAICTARGLGYIPYRLNVLTDQHFTQRGRFARLVRALALTGRSTGWGVGGEAAFYVDLKNRTAEVVGVPGKAFVTVIGRQGPRRNHEQEGPPFLGEGYTLSVLAAGDTYALPDFDHPHGEAFHPNVDEIYDPFYGYYDTPPVLTDALGVNMLINEITTYIADGTAQESGARVDAVALDVEESGAATGFLFRFTANDNTEVAWNSDAGYSMYDARLKISTVTAEINGLEP